MRKFIEGLATVTLLSACGSSNFNSLLVNGEQKRVIDQLLKEAQYEYDANNTDKALELTAEALKINPYDEKTLILRSYSYLSKAGLDGFKLSKNLIVQSEASSAATKTTSTTASSTKTGDSTADNLSSLASLIGLTKADLSLLGTEKSIKGTTIYEPKTRTEARAALSTVLQNINAAVETLCPIIATGSPKDSLKDTRHACSGTPYAIQGQAKSHFAWALAHLGEAIAFYSVVLYDDGESLAGVRLGPNIQRISAKLDTNPTKIAAFLDDLTLLTATINKIFPTDAAGASDSMLNAMFNNLKVTGASFAAMGGVPESVTKSIDESISNLTAKVSKISGTTDSGATSEAAKQNAAIRNALTTGVATKLDEKIKTLSGADKTKACELYQQINSDPSKKPSNCA